MLVINPEECIDCNLCVPECPIDAIVPEDELTEEQMPMLDLNAELSKAWPVITEIKPPPADADEWKDTPDKLQYLDKGDKK
jgi:ferredoxin